MRNKVLEILEKTDNYISGQDISKELGVSRQSVWKAINALKERGYIIDSITNKGYKLITVPNYLNAQGLKNYLNTAIIGKKLIVFDTIGSTNDYLKSIGSNKEECINGTVAVSREQTKGKGRLGRVWQTKKDDGIAFSFLLRPNMTPNEVSAITPLTGLAVCKAIKQYTGLNCKIKWPNDIIIENRKLVGILTEMSAEFDAVEYVITGIGINVEHKEFPEEIAYKATSIFLETGKHINKNEFLAYVLKQIEDEFIRNDMHLTPQAIEEYTEMCATIGRNVTFERFGKKLSGIATDIEKDGELSITLDNGEKFTVNSGEVTVQGIY